MPTAAPVAVGADYPEAIRDDSPRALRAAVRRTSARRRDTSDNRALNSTSHNQLTLRSGAIIDQRGDILTDEAAHRRIPNRISSPVQDGRVFEALPAGSDSSPISPCSRSDATAGCR